MCVVCALVLSACGGGADTNSNSSTTSNANKTATTTTTTTTNTPATTTSSPAATTPASGEKIGVPECDDYLAKFDTCMAKIPTAARPQYEASMKQLRDSWHQAASTPAGKAGLAQGCKAATDMAKQSMKSFGCEF